MKIKPLGIRLAKCLLGISILGLLMGEGGSASGCNPTVVTFRAEDPTVLPGVSTYLAWEIDYGKIMKNRYAEITSSESDDVGEVDNVSGTVQVFPTETTTYTLKVTADDWIFPVSTKQTAEVIVLDEDDVDGSFQTFDFITGQNTGGWSGALTDYDEDNKPGTDYQFSSGVADIPQDAGLGTGQGFKFTVKGNGEDNDDDVEDIDLFMYMTAKVSGLKKEETYTLNYFITYVTNVPDPKDCKSGQDMYKVYLKVGALDEKPVADDETKDRKTVPNFDPGTGSESGANVTSLGNIGLRVQDTDPQADEPDYPCNDADDDDDNDNPYQRGSVNNYDGNGFSITSDEDGEFYLIVGFTDMWKGKLSVWIEKISMIINGDEGSGTIVVSSI